jgi:tRNA modification GTPase
MNPISVTAAEETIAAVASAPGTAARGIIRISGARTVGIVTRLCRLDTAEHGTAARRYETEIALNASATLAASVFLWPTARSYTGQPMAELHLPGSPALLEIVLEKLFHLGIRPARRGEFTLRSFLAGRLDLIQAEAVLGVIDAFDSDELKTALQQLAGGLSGKIENIRGVLLNVLADLEAGLDFVEDDIKFVSQQQLIHALSDCRATIQQLYEDTDSRMHSTGRLRIVLAGLPNVGKSTLFNRLVGQNQAIVSSQTGTTRDWLWAPVRSDGLEFDLIDTAGWENPDQENPDQESATVASEQWTDITENAQQQRENRIQEADLVLWCTATDITADEAVQDNQQRRALAAHNLPVLPVVTKADLSPSLAGREGLPEIPAIVPASWPQACTVGALNHTGLDDLLKAIVHEVSTQRHGHRQLVGSTAARARESLRQSADAIGRAVEAAQLGTGDELIAIEIRGTLDYLGEIVGAVYTDDILDRIFSRFCIGK